MVEPLKSRSVRDVLKSAGVKLLSRVDVVSPSSNQHELNGVSKLGPVLGEPSREKQPARFVWLGDDEDSPVEDGTLTFYDARERQPSRSELRLYYPGSVQLVRKMAVGDFVFVLRPHDGPIVFAVAPSGSTTLLQMAMILGLPASHLESLKPGRSTLVVDTLDGAPDLDQGGADLLERLGLVVPDGAVSVAEELVEQFGQRFPSTQQFSDFARRRSAVDGLHNPDEALMTWVTTEERIFRAFERLVTRDQLRELYEKDVDLDAFVDLSLSIQNRRKSRAGASFENQLSALFTLHEISFVNNATTERRVRPDFLFPGKEAYATPDFPTRFLTILGAKRTCKDRWRQVLSEADRVEEKHLVTLESPISVEQTDEMRDRKLRLVVPEKLHRFFDESQRAWLLTVADFITLVRVHQEEMVASGWSRILDRG